MGRVWVLDTETKGTGAEMVPLEKLLERKAAPKRERISVIRRESARPQEVAPKPKPPRRFRVVDVMMNEVLVEDSGARATVDALGEVRSIVDVRIYVWNEAAEDWRPLTPAEKRGLWRFRDQAAPD
jgi:hypothetical protein